MCLKLIGSVLLAALGIVTALGCGNGSKPATQPSAHHADHEQTKSGHDHGGATHALGEAADLMVSTIPEQVEAGKPITLALMLHDSSGKMLKDFEETHEKLAHLIIIREGLDEFAHLHPDVDAAGNMTIDHVFPLAGRYHVFLDYKPKDGAVATAYTQIEVDGHAAAAQLTPNAPGDITVGELITKVDLKSGNDSTTVSFDLRDAAGTAITDLQPYLGAMGHLVVVSADGSKYVHAHPLSGEPRSSVVRFEVHFPAAGLYKLWGQFQRNGDIITVPAVVDYGGAKHAH